MAIFNKNTPAEHKPNWLRRTGVPAVVASLAITGCSVESDNSAENNAPIIPSSELAEPSQATKPSETSVATTDQDRVEEASSVNTPESSSSAIDLSGYPKPTTYEELLKTPFVLGGKVYETREAAVESCLIPSTYTPSEAMDKLINNLQEFTHAGQTPAEAELYDGFVDMESSPIIKGPANLDSVAINTGAKIEYDYKEVAAQCLGEKSLSQYLAKKLVLASYWDAPTYRKNLRENIDAPTTSLELQNKTILDEGINSQTLVADFVFRSSSGDVLEVISDAFYINLKLEPGSSHWIIDKVVEAKSAQELLPQPTN